MFVHEHRPSGLILARDGMDEASVGRALRRATGGRFVLQKRRRHEDDPNDVEFVYKVVHVESGAIAFTWMDEYGRGLPLSSGLIDDFLKRLEGSRDKPLDADDHNAKIVAERRKDADRMREEILSEHAPYIARDRTSVSMGPNKKPRYWRRANKVPQSGKDLRRG